MEQSHPSYNGYEFDVNNIEREGTVIGYSNSAKAGQAVIDNIFHVYPDNTKVYRQNLKIKLN